MGRSAHGRAGVALGAGALLLALTWRASPLPSPPMYEGLVGPAEDYRYLHPPPGLTTPQPPSTVHTTVAVLAGGHSPPLSQQTTEKPPQAQLLAPQGALDLPPGATTLTVSIAAVDPPPEPPPGGAVDGNVYDFAVSAAGIAVPVRSGQRVTVVLRNPAGIANPTLERYAGGRWTRLDTSSLGALAGDSYAADTAALGDIALVAAPGSTRPGGGVDVFVIALAGGALALTAGTLIALRRRNRGAPPRRRLRRPTPPARRGR